MTETSKLVDTNTFLPSPLFHTTTYYHSEKNQDNHKPTIIIIPFWRLFRFASKLDILLLLFASIISCVAGAIQPISIFYFGEIFKKIIQEDTDNDLIKSILPTILQYVYVGIGMMASVYVSRCLWILIGENQTKKIRSKYIHSILSQDISWFDCTDVSSLTKSFTSDIQLVQNGLSASLGQILTNMAQIISGCVVAFNKSWRLSIVIMAVIPIFELTTRITGMFISKYTNEAQNNFVKAGFLAKQTFVNVRTVYSFSLQNRFYKYYNELLEKALHFRIKRGIILGIDRGVFMFSLFAIYALSFWYGYRLVQDKSIDGASVLVVFLSMMMGAFSLLQIPMDLSNVTIATFATFKIYKIIDLVPEINNDKGLQPKHIQGEIEFKNVTFKYPVHPHTTVLDDVNFKISKGMTVALVGSLNTSKLAIMDLLQRFYDPNLGQISLDNINLKQLNAKWLRQQIGVINQEPILFNLTIRQNIMLGSSNPNISLDKVIDACKKAHCHRFIKELPQGYDTFVENNTLSYSQKQRISIARAILNNPTILLMNQQVAFTVDAQSQRLVQKALHQASKDRTTIIITQNLSTIQKADLVIVLDHGKLVEQGTHINLMRKGGYYSKMILDNKAQILDENDNRFTDHESDEYDEILQSNEAFELNQKNSLQIGHTPNSSVSINRTSLSSSSSSSSIQENDEKRSKRKKDSRPNISNKIKKPLWKIFMQIKEQRGWIILGCCGSILAGTTFPLYALFFSKLLVLLDEDEIVYVSFEGPNLYCFLFLLLGIFAFIGFAVQTMSFEIIGSYNQKDMKGLLFKALMKQEIGFHDVDKNNEEELSLKLNVDINHINEMITQTWGEILQIIFMVIIGLVISFVYTWELTLIIFCMSPLILGTAWWNSNIQERFETSIQKANKKSFETIDQGIKQIRTVAVFNKQDFFEHTYDLAIEKSHKLTQQKAYISSIGYSFLKCTGIYTNAVGFYVGTKLISQDKLEVGDMMAVLMSIMVVSEGIARFSTCVSFLIRVKSAIISTFEIINREPSIDIELEGIEPDEDEIGGSIDFNGISFCYPTQPDIPIFNGDFNLKIKKGQTVAFVGSPGCGTSAVISMLQRWYDPLTGVVRIDNHNVKSFSSSNLKMHMSFVGQDPTLFDFSIQDNIRFGAEDSKSVTDQDVQAVCKLTDIHDSIIGLQEGYQSRIDDTTVQLSEGQKQLIAISRALIRQPKILLLDKVTFKLNNQDEKLVQKTIDNIIKDKGRTIIIVPHRLSTITNVDLICVIKDGSIVEQGNHWDLLQQNGVYKELVQQQSFEN